MSLRLNGSTSGYVEIDAPAVAGTTSITIPATSGELAVKATDGSVDLGGVNVDSSGRLLVGASTSRAVGGNAPGDFQIEISGTKRCATFLRNGAHAIISLGATGATGIGDTTIVSQGDILGAIEFAGADGVDVTTQGASIKAEVDGTPGANDMPGRLVFSTTADGASSSTERMRIDRNGKWYLDNTDLFNGTYIGQIRLVDTGGLLFRNGGTAARFPLGFQNSAGAFVGSISAGNSSTSYNTSSDYRLKENIVEITDGISRIKQLQPKRFNFIIDTERTVDGFIAHEVQDIIPEAIHGEKDAVDDEGNPIYQGIDQSKLVPLLTAALQEAIAKIETLEAKVAALEVTP